MTIRTLFERKKRRLMGVAYISIAFGMVGVTLQQNFLSIVPPYAALPAFAVFALTLLYANLFAFWCPQCQKNWGTLAMQTPLFRLDRDIRYCPYCGADIDAELPIEQHVPTSH